MIEGFRGLGAVGRLLPHERLVRGRFTIALVIHSLDCTLQKLFRVRVGVGAGRNGGRGTVGVNGSGVCFRKERAREQDLYRPRYPLA